MNDIEYANFLRNLAARLDAAIKRESATAKAITIEDDRARWRMNDRFYVLNRGIAVLLETATDLEEGMDDVFDWLSESDAEDVAAMAKEIESNWSGIFESHNEMEKALQPLIKFY